MDVSVIICTRNRAASLQRTLQSITHLAVPEGLRWELVIVDNGSSDDTASVIAGFANVLPVVGTHESRAGISHARNCGVAAASGAYLAWTDDDVIVDRQWLAAYADAFRRWPEAALFGGKVIPVLEEPSPAWFRTARDEFGLLMAYRDFGDAPVAFSSAGGVIPFGANMAIRAADQRSFPYNPAFGPGPGRNRTGDETTILHQMLASGLCGYWVPGAKVEHCIPLQRQTIQYVTKYYATLGETDAALQGPGTDPRLFGAPRWLWRRVGELYLKYWIARLTAAPQSWCRSLKTYAYFRGVLAFHMGGADR